MSTSYRVGIPLLFVAFTTLYLFSTSSLYSQSQSLNVRPNLSIQRSTGSIHIDGKLGDHGWSSATKVADFIERNPGDNLPADVHTEVYIAYDENALYVAYVCHDDPSAIRATMSQRDQWFGDDAVVLLIDTYGTATVAYELFVNPYGIQKDMLWTSVADADASYDLLWESAAQRTSDGYTVEISVPFSSLRFPDRPEQAWKVDFWRNRPRETMKQYSWTANDRNEQCWPCQWGTVTGIRDVKPGKGIEILPSFVASQSGSLSRPDGASSRFENTNPEGELALGGKYALTSDITVEATYNPDFSQIEADAAQIDVNSTIALMYPERRPFFQEGSDIFRTLFNSFYTRTINDPIFAAKMTGRTGKTTIGVLTAYEENTPYLIPLPERSLLFNSGKSTANVVRVSHALGNDSRLGMILTDRRWDKGGSGTVAAIDGDFRLSKSYSIDGQYIGTHTRELFDPEANQYMEGMRFDDGKYSTALDEEKFYGTGLISRFRRQARSWSFTLDYDHVSPSYRTETGYDPLNDYRNLSLYSQYTFYTKSGLIERIIPKTYNLKRWFWNGSPKASILNVGTDLQLRTAQTYLSFYYSKNTEHYLGTRYADLWETGFNVNARPTAGFGFGLYGSRSRGIARFALTETSESNIGFSVSLKPFDRLIVESDLSYSGADDWDSETELFSGYISRSRFLYQATRALSLRVIVQYNDFAKAWDVDPLVTYKVSPFSVLYVGSSSNYSYVDFYQDEPSKWRLTSRQFFMKLQYLFQT
ncbi:MAG: carbohydrate binding family 9 domain-containing protein [bacterium]|nr:carbohydrate binding family 9 domain-containing protein [bacterium]